jgi:hypothetical protein
MVALTIDASQLNKLQKTLANIEKGVPKVLVPAINRALAKGRTELKREIRKSYLIKASDIPVRIERATYGALGGAVIVEQGMLPLGKFRYRGGRKKPLFVQVRTSGGGIIKDGFVGTMPEYTGPYRRRQGVARLPIKKLLTIGASIMASQPSVGPVVNKAMGDTLDKRIDHEMKRVLAKG